jgi:hypothetical protein
MWCQLLLLNEIKNHPYSKENKHCGLFLFFTFWVPSIELINKNIIVLNIIINIMISIPPYSTPFWNTLTLLKILHSLSKTNAPESVLAESINIVSVSNKNFSIHPTLRPLSQLVNHVGFV